MSLKFIVMIEHVSDLSNTIGNDHGNLLNIGFVSSKSADCLATIQPFSCLYHATCTPPKWAIWYMSKLLRPAATQQITGFLHGGDMPGAKWNKQHRPGAAPISHNCIVSCVCHHFTVIFYYHFTPIVLRLLYHRRTTAQVYTAPSQLGLHLFRLYSSRVNP